MSAGVREPNAQILAKSALFLGSCVSRQPLRLSVPPLPFSLGKKAEYSFLESKVILKCF